MAPVLQCPDCGTKHPLSDVPSAGTFPCKGCGRLLKVPEFVPRAATTSAPGPAPVVPAPQPAPSPQSTAAPPMEPTRALPVLERNREPTMSAESATIASPPLGRISAVPLWMRLLLWIVAVPLSFFVVFGIARAFGWFTTNQLSDVFLANDAGRFWPVVRLLPFVALLTAFVVHGGVLLIARRRVH